MLKRGDFEYEEVGQGEVVLLIHGGIVCDSDQPLMAEPALTQRYHVVRYHRRGFAGSAPTHLGFGIPDHARDALRLLQDLGVDRSHLVGHFFGGSIALQLAHDAPAAVQSIVLSDPAVLFVPGTAAFMALLAPAIARMEAGDYAGAVDQFMQVRGRGGLAHCGAKDAAQRSGAGSQRRRHPAH